MNDVPEEFRGESRAVGYVIHPPSGSEWRERAERAEARVAELEAELRKAHPAMRDGSRQIMRLQDENARLRGGQADRDAALDLLRVRVKTALAIGLRMAERAGDSRAAVTLADASKAVGAFLARVDSGTEPK